MIDRREALRLMAAAGASLAVPACVPPPARGRDAAGSDSNERRDPAEGAQAIGAVTPLGQRWETSDPFLFCAHHDDRYPRGNEAMGPAADLAGRQLGRDFAGKDGWNMYHGAAVPGFPKHPHRGFETVTVVRTGLLDHSDSLGARARYGGGDVQWLTAGAGINHAEMFPLLRRDQDNPLELFQIWLNLPRAQKMVRPRFSMLWNETIPRVATTDEAGRQTVVTIVAGSSSGMPKPPSPPPDSYAARGDSDVAIWTIGLEAGATWRLPPAAKGSERSLYFFQGKGLRLGTREIPEYHRVQVLGDATVAFEAAGTDAEILLLQGRPIGEPVAHQGPFVMNTRAEIRQAYEDYRRSGFGGWPWEAHDPVHGAAEQRFAQYADGTLDQPV